MWVVHLSAVELGQAAINEAMTGGYAVGDMGSTNNVDTLKNIWFDDTEAWEGIDEVRHTLTTKLSIYAHHLPQRPPPPLPS